MHREDQFIPELIVRNGPAAPQNHIVLVHRDALLTTFAPQKPQ
jgi:hypothetical protein